MPELDPSAPAAGAETATPSVPPRPRRRRFLRVLAYGTVVLFLLGLGAAFAAYLVYDYVTRPGIEGQPVTVTIPEGATGKQAGEILAEHGLLEHEVFLRMAMRLDGRPLLIKHGTYDLARGLSPKDLVERLRKGPQSRFAPGQVPDDRRVTVPEGLSIAQASQLFDDPEAFVAAASDPELIAELGIDAPNLEGFLMPNTYYFDRKPTEREAVERMLKQFKVEWAKIVEEIPEAAGQDLLKVITIASLIEEEARVDEERPLISAVVHNRVAKNMHLGIDATLQFATNKYGERMLDKDKEVDSPYNTYLHVGLPPGPICSPGPKSIRAALRPAEEDYLYFVSNADGKTHTFSKTLGEHNRAVAEYRRKIAVQRRELRRQQAEREGEAGAGEE
jgi:UPF0755 protein